MTQILELPDREFYITMVKMLKNLMKNKTILKKR